MLKLAILITGSYDSFMSLWKIIPALSVIFFLTASNAYGQSGEKSAQPEIELTLLLTFGEGKIDCVHSMKILSVSDKNDSALKIPMLAPVIAGNPADCIFLNPVSQGAVEFETTSEKISIDISEKSEIVLVVPSETDFPVEIRWKYRIPVNEEEILAGISAPDEISGLHIVARSGERIAPLIRPLLPYSYSIEKENNMKTEFFDLDSPLKKGNALIIRIANLPVQFMLYKKAALSGIFFIAASFIIFAVFLQSKKRKS
jgi:hypothetical protein